MLPVAGLLFARCTVLSVLFTECIVWLAFNVRCIAPAQAVVLALVLVAVLAARIAPSTAMAIKCIAEKAIVQTVEQFIALQQLRTGRLMVRRYTEHFMVRPVFCILCTV